MDRKHAQRWLQSQGYVDPTAQVVPRIDVEAGEVWVDVVMDASPHDDTDTLHHMVMAHMDRVLLRWEQPRGDRRPVHLLDPYHVSVKIRRVALQQLDVLRSLRSHILRQVALAHG